MEEQANESSRPEASRPRRAAESSDGEIFAQREQDGPFKKRQDERTPNSGDETLKGDLERVFERVSDTPKRSTFGQQTPAEVQPSALPQKLAPMRLASDPEILQPRDPSELPILREDTIHAIVTAKALKERGRQARFSVPETFVGLLTDSKGQSETLLLPGEEATGDFVLHLFKSGSLLAPLRADRLESKDGFEARAESELGIRLDTADAEALREFLANYSSGSSHLSVPVVKSRFEKGVKEALRRHAAKFNVEELLKDPKREEAEHEVTAALREHGVPAGLKVLGLDGLKFLSADYEKSKRKQLQAEREAKAKEEQAELDRALHRQEIERIKAQAALHTELAEVRKEQVKVDFETERERLEQKKAVDLLSQEFEREKASLTSDLQKMHAANEIEIESIKFDEYLKRAQRLREELDDDRIEFYIQQIGDERLKADLLKRLIERTMTPEQLRELAELERVRSEHLTPLPPNFGEESEVQIEREAPPQQVTRDASGRKVSIPAQAVEATDATQARASGVSQSQRTVQQAPSDQLDDQRRVELNHPLMEKLDVTPLPQSAVLEEGDKAQAQRFPMPTKESSSPQRFAPQDERAQTEAMFDTQALEPVQLEEARAREEGRELSTDSTHLRQREDERDDPADVRYALLAAGRSLFAAHISPEGKVSELERYLDLSQGPLGSLRSICRVRVEGEGHLLIGARRGLYSIKQSNRQVKNYPLDAVFNPLTGVNSAIAHEGRFYATHSQFGLLRWAIPAPNQPASRFLQEYTENAQSIRSIFLDDDYWPTFAVGNRILAIEHGVVPRVVAAYSGAPSPILLACSLDKHFYAACEDGSIVTWDKSAPERCERRARTREALSGATLSTDGQSLVLCSRSNIVRVYDLRKGSLARYEAPQEIRVAREFGDYLFGIARNRSALYIWKSYDSTTPISELPLPDACFDVAGV